MNLELLAFYTYWEYPIVPIATIIYSLIAISFTVYGIVGKPEVSLMERHLIPTYMSAIVFASVFIRVISEYEGEQFVSSLEFIYACIPILVLSIISMPGLILSIKEVKQ